MTEIFQTKLMPLSPLWAGNGIPTQITGVGNLNSYLDFGPRVPGDPRQPDKSWRRQTCGLKWRVLGILKEEIDAF